MSSQQIRAIAGARRRSTVRLGRNLEKNLFAYATAASAALVSLSARADAQIIYTPSNTPMAIPGFNEGPVLTQFDLNNDGKPDFSFKLSSFSHYLYRFKFFLRILPAQTGNEVVQGPQRGVAALPTGVKVGPEQQFAAAGYLYNFSYGVSGLHESGSWGQVEYAYVGVKFTIKGQFHYGWVRVKFPSTGKWNYASISGYAYESTPNKPIITGRTSGSSQQATTQPSPTALGVLAAGASGLDFWRK
jgi:hypothetical protein